MCCQVVREFAPALFGGFVFGFSPYLICKLLGDIDLALVPMLPLAVYLTMRALDGTVRRRNFIVLLALVLCAQFLLFIETFATMTMSAAIAIAIALLVTGVERPSPRPRAHRPDRAQLRARDASAHALPLLSFRLRFSTWNDLVERHQLGRFAQLRGARSYQRAWPPRRDARRLGQLPRRDLRHRRVSRPDAGGRDRDRMATMA